MQKARGFSLIELMVVVAIIGVLARMAFASYTNYVIRANRVTAQGELSSIAQSMERYKGQNFSYGTAGSPSLSSIYGATQVPRTGIARYTLTLTNTPGAFTIQATPTGAQVGDGAIIIDNQGRRCRNPSSDSTCDLTNVAQSW